MPEYSAAASKKINALVANELPVFLLEIDHVLLPSPTRVVNYSEDIVHLGNTFVALSFEITPPGDFSQGLPRAGISIDNVGRDLTDWVELSKGGRGSSARLIQVLPSDPDTIEWDITMNLENVSMTVHRVNAELTFDDFLNLPGVALTYRPDVAPGLF